MTRYKSPKTISKDNNRDMYQKNPTEKEQKKWGNNSEIASLFINLFLMLLTFSLFWKTGQAVDQAKIANRITDSALNRQISKDSTDSIFTLNKFTFDTTVEQKKYYIDSTSIQTQINSLKEQNKEFIILNDPILYISSFKFDKLNLNEPINIDYRINNTSSYPTVINFMKYDIKIIDTIKTKKIRFNSCSFIDTLKLDLKNKQHYTVTKDNSYETITTLTEPINNETFENIKKNKCKIYFFGKILYKSSITKKDKILKFCYCFSDFEITSNTNIKFNAEVLY